MSGVDTLRGVGYQQAQAVLEAVSALDDLRVAAIRIEGKDDVVDLELLDHHEDLVAGKQFKVRSAGYTWSKGDILSVLRRWVALPAAATATFEFVTDGRLGPSGEELDSALLAAGDGSPGDLAQLLGERTSAPSIARLSRARVVRDPTNFAALIHRAERQVMAMLPSPVSAAEARVAAEGGVNALLRLLMHRAGLDDPAQRVVDRKEIAETLGVPDDQSAAQRWASAIRQRYLAAASALSLDAAPIALTQTGAGLTDVPVGSLGGARLALLVGRTGEGKTTACRALVRQAATNGQAVLHAHAEAYLPGRLAALVADAISDVLDEAMPASTGLQAIQAGDVTLVIDGASEVPDVLQEGLREDLRPIVAVSQPLASVVLCGRDVAALGAMLPHRREPEVFAVRPLDHGQRRDIAERVLRSRATSPREATHVRFVAAAAERALGDAAGNPMLFAMAVELLEGGASFTDRPGLYAAFAERLAARSGAKGVAIACRALGIAFARLLDQQRRFADPYEWGNLIAGGAAAVTANAAAVEATARKSGIVVAQGYVQTVVPFHDSFADYLAGMAHALDLAPMPDRLSAADEQRVTFAAEIAGVSAEIARTVARDLPMLTVAIAALDRREFDDDAPCEVTELLRALVGNDRLRVALWRTRSAVIAFLDPEESDPRWLTDAEAEALASTATHLELEGGPLDAAVRLWRATLRDAFGRLAAGSEHAAPAHPKSIGDAIRIIESHARAEAELLERMLGALPEAAQATVAANLGPLGLTAHVVARPAGEGWSVTYRATDDIRVAAGGELPASDLPPASGWGGIDRFLMTSPAADAVRRMHSAVDRSAGRHPWL